MPSLLPLSAVDTSAVAWPSAKAGVSTADGAAFRDALLRPLQEANQLQHRASHLVEQLYTGGNVNPAEALIAVQKADMAFRLLLQLRNKLIQAYDEVKNIRI